MKSYISKSVTKITPFVIVVAIAFAGFSCTPKAETPVEEEMATDSVAVGDIITVARDAGVFGTLLAAVDSAGLTGTLMGPGPYTVFAPTDEAFAKLADGTVASWLMPENREMLRSVLTYHVVNGKVMAADIVTLPEAATLNGAVIRIATGDSGVMLNDSTAVVTTDIEASNGVIHVIGTVLMPPPPAPAN